LFFYRRKAFLVLCAAAVLTGLYALAGFVLAPRLIRSALLEDIPKAIGAQAAVGDIRVNPFLLQLEVKDFSLAGAGGEKLLGFQRLFVDLELSSLWYRAFSFGRIDIDSPYVSAVVAQDGALNLMQLKPKAAPAPAPAKPQEKPAGLPSIRIGSFEISQGLLTYEDHSQPDVFAARLEPINFELQEFTTGVEGGKFTFTGSSKLGERIEWHGHLSAQPIESDGEFQINGLFAHTLWEYLQDRLNFDVNSGSIDLAATYQFSAGDGGNPGNLRVDVSKVGLSHLAVRPKGADADWITVPDLEVTGTTVDLAKRQAHVDLVALTGLGVTAWREPDGTVNLMKLAGAPGAAAGAGGKRTAATAATPPASTAPVAPTLATAAPAADSGPPWQFDLREFDLRDARLSMEDRSTSPAVKVLLAPVTINVTGASQDLSKPVHVALDLRVNEKGAVKLSGDVTPQPVSADLTLEMTGVELAVAQPYIAQHASMTLLSGELGAAAKLHYGPGKGMPALQFAGKVAVENLHTVDNALQADFINWDRLEIDGLKFTQGPDRLDIEQIVARKPYARVIIESDESMNVKRILAAPGAAGAESGPVPQTAAPTPAAAASRPAKKAAGAPEPAVAAAAPTPMPMSIRKILVQAGQANFADLSIRPNFSTGIQGLEGSIVGLSSRPDSRAKMDLHGSVDKYSPVSVTGEFNVLGPKLYTDVALNFSNIELTVFNPYSGKFAGYNISKGKLSTDLHYKVDGRALDAQHHIVVDQLEFGDKTASKDAVSLPIKLAVSLLKDRNGVIDLNLPVTGTLDDPKFRLGPIIWRVFVNLLEKAITAPFALLGSLFGGGPDIQFIDFRPGRSALDAAAADKARNVAKALIERPQLKIAVPIAVVPPIDRPALIAAQYGAELADIQAAKGSAKKGAAAPPTPPDFAQLDPRAQLDVLTRLYAKDLGGSPQYPETVTGLKSKAEIVSAKVDYLGTTIREHIQVGDAELLALGQERAKQLQQALLADSQLGADRVFLVANDKAKSQDGLVRLELTLQ